MKNRKKMSRLPVDVTEALRAIATTGKGRCWYCDVRLPEAGVAIANGWDVQRVEELPVASIILVCPACLSRDAAEADPEPERSGAGAPSVRVHAAIPNGNGARRVLALEPKRA